MKEITAEDKDRVLSWFYEADVDFYLQHRTKAILTDSLKGCPLMVNNEKKKNGLRRIILELI